jgi:hypothetical protein
MGCPTRVLKCEENEGDDGDVNDNKTKGTRKSTELKCLNAHGLTSHRKALPDLPPAGDLYLSGMLPLCTPADLDLKSNAHTRGEMGCTK